MRSFSKVASYTSFWAGMSRNFKRGLHTIGTILRPPTVGRGSHMCGVNAEMTNIRERRTQGRSICLVFLLIVYTSKSFSNKLMWFIVFDFVSTFEYQQHSNYTQVRRCYSTALQNTHFHSSTSPPRWSWGIESDIPEAIQPGSILDLLWTDFSTLHAHLASV